MVRNLGLIFKKVPSGYPVPGQDLTIEDRPLDLNASLSSGSILVRNHVHSYDPYQRGRMRAPDVKSYSPPYDLGKPVVNSAIGKVVKSNSEKFKEGETVVVWQACPTEEYSVLGKEIVDARVQKLENPYGLEEALWVGALGMPGLTAWSSFYAIGEPQKGETIFISAASGAVGQLVGQLAKHEGLTVIGSVGSDDKLEYITKELGFDSGFNYKKEKPADALARLAPNGIDIYYENVGGEQLEAAIDAMNNHGRIIACGMISQYNLSSPSDAYPIRNMFKFVAKRIKMQGFIVNDPKMGPIYREEHQKKLQKWIKEGTFKAKMSETKGMEKAAEGLVGMLKGENFGKAVLVLSEHEQ